MEVEHLTAPLREVSMCGSRAAAVHHSIKPAATAMEVEELAAVFREVSLRDSRTASAHHLVTSAAMIDDFEPAMIEEVCTLRLRFPNGRVLCKNFGAKRPAAALYRYCHSVLVQSGAKGQPFRLLRLAGGASDEIRQFDSSFQDLGLHHCTIHVVLGLAP